MKFEYKIFEHNKDYGNKIKLIDCLNSIGEDGWDVFQIETKDLYNSNLQIIGSRGLIKTGEKYIIYCKKPLK